MPYSVEVTRRAQQRLAQQKADQESKYNHRLFEAYEKLPRLKELDMALRKSVVLAAQAAFTKGQDVTQVMQQVKQANLAMQEERKALLEANFAPGWLDDSPICPHCGGSGYIGAVMCSCLKELCRQEQKQELLQLTSGIERFESFRLDYYPAETDPVFGVSPRKLMERNLQICQKYAEAFGAESGNLLFVGGTGLGKTFLSACIANAVAEKAHRLPMKAPPISLPS